jgi:hypothetical protein
VPFNTAISRKVTHDEVPEEDSDNEPLPEVEQDNNDDDDDGDDNKYEEEGNDDEDDSVNELQELSENKQVQIMKSMAVVCVTVTKV